jgi:ATP-dependent Clp protease ATP-binding subunit ClpA
MVGDPGVGKTAIVDGLAQRIAKNDVPEFLKGHEVWSLRNWIFIGRQQVSR